MRKGPSMLARNLLQPGESVCPIPLGIPVKVNYGPKGTIEAVLTSSDNSDNYENRLDLYSILVKYSNIPTRVPTLGGTVCVHGVVYVVNSYKACGNLRNDFESIIISEAQNLGRCKFYAGYVESTSITFTGSMQRHTWLKSQRFDTLPLTIVPYDNVDKWLHQFISASPFNLNTLIGFYGEYKSKFSIHELGLYQDKVESINTYLDKNGYVMAKIGFTELDPIYTSLYSIKQKNLAVGDYVVVDLNLHKINAVIIRSDNPKKLDEYTVYKCPVCSKRYSVDEEFKVCPNPQCPSTMYCDVVQFFETLNLPVISYDDFSKYVNDKKLNKFGDILLLPEYSECQIFVSLYDFLDAIIPNDKVRNRDSIWELYTKCNGSWDSIVYYLNHPNDIISDLRIEFTDLIHWLKAPGNVDRIFDIFNYSNVSITPEVKKFEGSPIFRNKSIYLTGQFRRGNYAEISGILSSYSASLVTNWEDADCCLVGDIPSDVNGYAVRGCKSKGIPVFFESEFFNLYELDSEM